MFPSLPNIHFIFHVLHIILIRLSHISVIVHHRHVRKSSAGVERILEISFSSLIREQPGEYFRARDEGETLIEERSAERRGGLSNVREQEVSSKFPSASFTFA